MEKQEVVISQDLETCLANAIAKCPPDRLFVLTDTTTVQLCWPLVKDYPCLSGAQVITIGSTDDNKTLESLCHVWSHLQEARATRHSLLINLGGGMITDLGGFAASTFKRGIQYINIPTTLLSMVENGLGMSIVHETILHPARFNVVTLPLDKTEYFDVGMGIRKGGEPSTVPKLFMEHIKNCIPGENNK